MHQLRLSDRVSALEGDVRTERMRSDEAQKAAKRAGDKVEAVLAHSDPQLIDQLKTSHPTLFAP